MDANDLLFEQVKDLEKRIKVAISDSIEGLTESLVIEYVKIVQTAVINSIISPKEIEYIHKELLLLKSEIDVIPNRSKADPLIQLRWLDNSLCKLKLLVEKLRSDKEDL